MQSRGYIHQYRADIEYLPTKQTYYNPCNGQNNPPDTEQFTGAAILFHLSMSWYTGLRNPERCDRKQSTNERNMLFEELVELEAQPLSVHSSILNVTEW